MDEKKLGVILGALLHDIGKFMQRAEVPCRYVNDERQMQVVCRYHKAGDYFSHRHTLWTVEFFEVYQEAMALVVPRFENPEDTLLNLAAKHHNPDTPLQWLISEADRLSSGMDRRPKDEEDEIQRRDSFKRTRLRPILEEISLNGYSGKKSGRKIELNELSIQKDALFPKSLSELDPKEGDLLVDRYKDLWMQFARELTKKLILSKHSAGFLDTMLFLLEKYTWCIPSSTMDLPDISLFDHSKTTAAIAACLYDHHTGDSPLEERDVQDRTAHKYSLVCGDISGIQKFIYNITSKGAAKGLKGRSFLLQLLVEAAAKFILRRLDYPMTNLLYSSGGRFYLLIASKHNEALQKFSREINRALLEKYDGELYLALGWKSLRGSDFMGKNFPPKWKEAAQEANRQKSLKFADVTHAELFEPFGRGVTEKTCDICKREVNLEPRDQYGPETLLCPDCKEAEQVGKRLSASMYLIEAFDEHKGAGDFVCDMRFLKTKYYLTNDPGIASRINAESVTVYRLNSTDFLEDTTQAGDSAYGFKFVGGTYLPQDDNGEALTFNDFADRSSGIKRLGVLRMDVDNLGKAFTKGFGDKASISRVVTLSRRLSPFFAGYLDVLCQKRQYKDRLTIIYSGGDDLFVLGAWDKTVHLAQEITREFEEFCLNPGLTISGGVALVPQKYPVYRGAKHAGNAEKKAKQLERKDGTEKNAFTFLNKALGWHDFNLAREIKDLLCVSIRDGKLTEDGSRVWLSKGILDRLRRIYVLYEKNKTYWLGQADLSLEVIEERLRYHKWLWRSVYTLQRAIKQNSLFEKELQALKLALFDNSFEGNKSETDIIGFLDIPTRWVELLLREEER